MYKPTKTYLDAGNLERVLLEVPSLTEIYLCEKFNKPFDQYTLPPNITRLRFSYEYNQPLDNLSQNITHLTIDGCFNQNLDKLPHSLTHLELGLDFDKPLEFLPPNLVHLKLSYEFDQPVVSTHYLTFYPIIYPIFYIHPN